MRVIIRKRALKAIVKTSIYIENQNTIGSGERWSLRLKEKINSLARAKVKLALCKQVYLARYGYSCYNYKDWVIVFKATCDEFEICRFIHGSRLK